MELEIGSTVGDYEVVGTLGAGGMGKVYKVRNTISDRIEAMKILLPDLATAPELADRFLREIKVQASLDHPNIAQLHTAVRAGNQLLMVMEFVDGETLEQKLKRGPFPVAQTLEYIGQVLSALEFAHARGVVHRDIKPANMMVTAAGTLKLMDFGIAKAAADQKLTMTGTTMGSLYYMSPEQIQGSATLDARADLYSVGVTLYELVTGKRPFDGDSQYAIMAAHLEKIPVPPITLDPELPQALNDVILMSVAKSPNERFQSAAAFRNALRGVAAAILPATPPAAIAEPMPPPTADAARPAGKRWLWMSIGGIAAAAAIVCAIEFAPWKPTQAAPPTPQTSSVAVAQPSPTAEAAPVASAPPQEVAAPTQTPSSPPPAAGTAPTLTAAPSHATPHQQIEASKPSAPVPAAAPPKQVEQLLAQPAAATPTPVVKAGPSNAEVLEAREHFAKLQVRAGSIHDSLTNLKGSMQAQGMGLSAKFTQPEGLMNTYLRSATEALNQSDLAAAREYADKAERQIEILEKLLNL